MNLNKMRFKFIYVCIVPFFDLIDEYYGTHDFGVKAFEI